MKNMLTLFWAGLSIVPVFGQQKQEIVDYVAKYKSIAIEEMVRTGIPASITLAQGILESGCGQSDLSVKANNHFGIKCKDEWTGERFYQDDDAPDECFRVYANARESYADHSDFLLTRPRYADLFKLPAGDYKSWAYGLKAAGYATNPKYAPTLIGYIETYQLHQYDEIGYAQIEQRDNLIKESYENRETPAKQTAATIAPANGAPNNASAREEYEVNGIRAIRANGNEDPFTIAYKYQIEYDHLLAYNDLSNGEKFKDGENIFLQPKKNKTAATAYTVQAGESMHDISQKFGLRLKELYFRNLMYPNDQVKAGETVYLQTKRSSPPQTIPYAEYLKTVAQRETATAENLTATADEIGNNAAYEVQQKDTLYSIARKFNTTIEKIKEMNNIDGSEIRAGQTLVVSQ